MDAKKIRKIKIIATVTLVLVLAGLLCFLFSGKNFEVLKEIFNTNATKAEIQDSIAKLGWRAYFVVFIISAFQVVLTFVPAEPLHVISGISFGLWKGGLICLAGIMFGNTIIYILYKVYGSKISDFFASNIDVDFNAVQKSKKIALIVIILYCLPAIPYGLICFFAATMKMKYPKYILITGIGSIPSLILDVGLGHITMATSWVVSITIFVIIIILLIVMFKYKRQLFDKVNKYIHKSQEKQKNKVGKYNPVVYHLATTFAYGYLKTKLKLRTKKKVKKIDKPCIVLCNHGSFYDFLFAGKLVKNYQPHFVVARMYFHHNKLEWIASRTGAFPKSMFTTDVESSKNCLKVISGKGLLAMMPEARLSTVGKFEGIQDTTYKFIQKMNVPVYTIKSNGAYLAKPKWGDKLRKGALVETELDLLLEKGQAKEMPIEELKSKIENALTYNEWEWLEKHPEVKYKHKTLAEGLENILCICPKCKKKYCLSTNKRTITCDCCGMKVEMDDRYGLSGVKFKNIAQWYEWQTQEFAKEIEKKTDFCLKAKVELRHLSKDGKSCTRYGGKGVCTLTKEGLKYVGTDDGLVTEKSFEMKNIYRILFGAGEDFEIYDGNEIYYFVPENKKSCVAWYIVSGILKEKMENETGEKYGK